MTRPAHPSGRVCLGLPALAEVAVLASCGTLVVWRDADCQARAGGTPIGAADVTLQPGGSLALPLPAGRALDPATLTIALSEGTGILLVADLTVKDGAIVLPPAEDDQIVHLCRPAKTPAPIRLTLIWSAAEKQPALSRRLVPVEGLRVAAGTQSVRFPQLPLETPELAIRQALLPPLAEGARLVGTGGVTFSVTNPEPATVEAQLSLLTLPRRSASVSYQLDDGVPVEVALDAGTPEHVVRIAVPAGPHKIRFELGERMPNALVSLRAQDESGTSLDASRRRGYDLATRDEPLVLAFAGWACLRIDEYRDTETFSRYRALPAAAGPLTLLSEPGQEQTLLRVFQLPPRDAAAPSRLSLPTRTERVLTAGPLLTALAACPVLPAPEPK